MFLPTLRFHFPFFPIFPFFFFVSWRREGNIYEYKKETKRQTPPSSPHPGKKKKKNGIGLFGVYQSKYYLEFTWGFSSFTSGFNEGCWVCVINLNHLFQRDVTYCDKYIYMFMKLKQGVRCVPFLDLAYSTIRYQLENKALLLHFLDEH